MVYGVDGEDTMIGIVVVVVVHSRTEEKHK
jgi:hypothetical protein